MLRNQDQIFLQLLFVSFNLPLRAKEIAQWRGTVVDIAGLYNSNELFHNHNNPESLEINTKIPPPSTYHYRYPLIQYRVHKKHAAILAINQGIDVLQESLSTKEWHINWKNKATTLKIETILPSKHAFQILSKPKKYHLYKWLALNQVNYLNWQKCNTLTEKIALLKRILTAHLLALFKAFDWWLKEKLQVEIHDMTNREWIKIHDAPLLAFNIDFSVNVDLPLGLAIGKSVSLGFGWMAPFEENF